MMNIDKYIQDELNAIDNDLAEDLEIREKAKYISKQLLANPTVLVEDEEVWEVGVRHNSTKIVLIASSKDKVKELKKYNQTALVPKVYTPLYIEAEMNQDYEFDEILEGVVTAFLSKIKGKFRVEVLDEGTEKDNVTFMRK